MSAPFDSASLDIKAWLKKDRLAKSLESETTPATTLAEILFGRAGAAPEHDAQVSAPFESFLHSLVLEQLKKPEDLLKLNPSRRESLGRFLSELCRVSEPTDPQEALKKFTRIDRTEAEHEALKQLFKQISIVQIAKALLVKSWNVHSGFPLSKADLKDLTAAVERGLRPYIHLQTSTCQLIQRNFYSWYKLNADAQEQLWTLLEQAENLEALRRWLLGRARSLSAETLGERERYSQVFYENLWRSIEKHRLFQPRGETLLGFSPTLRDGCFLEHAPKAIDWIGFEPLSFELLFGEVRYFWKQPRIPPLWVKGTGLEMTMEQQASLLLTHSGKQNVLKQMEAISCCEVALIAEESPIRTQGRGLAAQALRKQIDEHSILKKLKQPTTTRGIYQACQALEKLRQGGTLIWAREELLNETSGKPSLHFILNQAKILMIADLSALECTRENLKRDIPKALYLLKKENNLEERKSHRPLLIKVYGTVSHDQDATILFDRIMALVQKPDQVFPMEPFKFHARVSPMDQREWEQHWFNPTDDELVDQIEDLKRNSIPFGQLAHIRTFHPSLHQNHLSDEPNLFGNNDTPKNSGFYVWVESNRNGNEIFTASADKLPEYMKSSHSVFWVTPMRAEWTPALQVLVRSQLTREWFGYSTERKKGAWLVKEGDFKAIPVPKHIADTLLKDDSSSLSEADLSVLSIVGTDPALAVKSVEASPHLKAQAFILASQILAQAEDHQGALFSLITPDEQIHYNRLFSAVFTANDLSPIHQHPLIRYTATLSPHQSIQSITLLKFPTPGVLLTTSKGLTQTLFIQDGWLRERCFEQLKELQGEISEPTWSEIIKFVKLPKNPDQAQSIADQILKAFGAEKLRRKELNHLLSVCLLSRKQNAERIGLLQ